MRLQVTDSALKDLKKLNAVAQKQIVKKLKFFMDQPDPLDFAVKLTNFTKGGDYRFRIGQFRAVFDFREDTIYILHIEHRRDVYRSK